MEFFKRICILFAVVLVSLGFVACQQPAEEAVTEETPAEGPAALAYRNAVNQPPEGWTGPVFELSHDYPATDPGPCPEEVCGWLYKEVDFSDTTYSPVWAEYMDAILAHVRKGQTLDPSGWNVKVDGETHWYHVPWMAYDPKVGREFIHGFTNERTAKTSDLLGEPHGLPNVPDSDGQFETWAFGAYNRWGGYAFGQAWSQDGTPNMIGNCDTAPYDGCAVSGLPFPEGTLVAKLLFTTATPELVGYLEGSPNWQANRHIEVGGCERSPQGVYLVQMDVAVVDERSPTRWVYGTYGYNGTIQSDDPWDRMSPLGVQWGGDPGVFPAVDDPDATTIEQTSLAEVNIYEHYGCEGRLAGPVDNKLASCMSCHAAGYAALPLTDPTVVGTNVPPIFGFDGICTEYNQTNVEYFSNWIFPAKWPDYPNTTSMDTSLQLQVAFGQYSVWKVNGKPNACTPST